MTHQTEGAKLIAVRGCHAGAVSGQVGQVLGIAGLGEPLAQPGLRAERDFWHLLVTPKWLQKL